MLKDAYAKPLIVVEGERLTGSGRVRPEATMDAYAGLLVDYGIPIVWMQKPLPALFAQPNQAEV